MRERPSRPSRFVRPWRTGAAATVVAALVDRCPRCSDLVATLAQAHPALIEEGAEVRLLRGGAARAAARSLGGPAHGRLLVTDRFGEVIAELSRPRPATVAAVVSWARHLTLSRHELLARDPDR